MIWGFVSTVLALLGYATMMTLLYRRAKSDAAELQIKVERGRHNVLALKKEVKDKSEMYERRLEARQEMINALRERIISNADDSDIGAAIADELSKEPEDPDFGVTD